MTTLSPRSRVKRLLVAACVAAALTPIKADEQGSGWFSLSLFGSTPSSASSGANDRGVVASTGAGSPAVSADMFRRDSCWHKPDVEALVAKHCASLTDEARGRIALAITNCHLSSVGLDPVPCDDDEAFPLCARRVGASPVGFATYTTFYSQVDTLCHFMRRDLFHLTTERAVHSLSAATSSATSALQSIYTGLGTVTAAVERGHAGLAQSLAGLEAQERARFQSLSSAVGDTHTAVAAVAKGQEDLHARLLLSLALQRELQDTAQAVERGQRDAALQLGALHTGISTLRGENQAAFTEARERVERLGSQSESGFHSVLKSQGEVEARLKSAQAGIDSISSLHERVLQQTEEISTELNGTKERLIALISEATGGIMKLRLEFSSATSMLFYPIALVVSLLLTALPRTSAARGTLFLLLACGFTAERLLLTHSDGLRARFGVALTPDSFADVTALIRYCLTLAALAAVAHTLATHRDPLREVQATVDRGHEELCRRLRDIEHRLSAAAAHPGSDTTADGSAGARVPRSRSSARGDAGAFASAGAETRTDGGEYRSNSNSSSTHSGAGAAAFTAAGLKLLWERISPPPTSTCTSTTTGTDTASGAHPGELYTPSRKCLPVSQQQQRTGSGAGAETGSPAIARPPAGSGSGSSTDADSGDRRLTRSQSRLRASAAAAEELAGTPGGASSVVGGRSRRSTGGTLMPSVAEEAEEEEEDGAEVEGQARQARRRISGGGISTGESSGVGSARRRSAASAAEKADEDEEKDGGGIKRTPPDRARVKKRT